MNVLAVFGSCLLLKRTDGTKNNVCANWGKLGQCSFTTRVVCRYCCYSWLLLLLIGIRLALLMRKLKKPYQKNRVRILLDPWLRRHGFFDTRIVHLHADHPDLCVYTRNIVTTFACSFVDTWRHVGVAKGFNPFLESHHAGWDSLAMRKVDKTWRVSIRPQALRGELEDCVLRVLRHFPACSNSRTITSEVAFDTEIPGPLQFLHCWFFNFWWWSGCSRWQV